MLIGTRNCPGNLTKSPGKEVEGGGGGGERGENYMGPHPTIPLQGAEYTPGRLKQQERR